MTPGEAEHTFDLAEWMTWRNDPPSWSDRAYVMASSDGSSHLYRLLMIHSRRSTHLLPEVAAQVWTQLKSGRETAEDGDELAEVCFRAAGRAGTATRDEQLGLAAALLVHFTSTIVPVRDVTPCVNYGVPAHPGSWRVAIRCCTRPAAARMVAR